MWGTVGPIQNIFTLTTGIVKEEDIGSKIIKNSVTYFLDDPYERYYPP